MLPEKVSETQAWFHKAAQDLRAGTLVLEAEPPIVDDALFHAQQAVEKAIKGFLIWHERPFRKTHDLREVGGSAISIDSSLAPLLQQAIRLTPFAGVFRYPGEIGEPTKEEAEEALVLAQEVFDAILARLPNEVRP